MMKTVSTGTLGEITVGCKGIKKEKLSTLWSRKKFNSFCFPERLMDMIHQRWNYSITWFLNIPYASCLDCQNLDAERERSSDYW